MEGPVASAVVEQASVFTGIACTQDRGAVPAPSHFSFVPESPSCLDHNFCF